jgi:hypothetical protein
MVDLRNATQASSTDMQKIWKIFSQTFLMSATKDEV